MDRCWPQRDRSPSRCHTTRKQWSSSFFTFQNRLWADLTHILWCHYLTLSSLLVKIKQSLVSSWQFFYTWLLACRHFEMLSPVWVGLSDHVKLLKHTTCRAWGGVFETFSPASLFALFYLPCSPLHLIPSCSVGCETSLSCELTKPLNSAKENCLEVLPLLPLPVSWFWLSSFQQHNTAFSLPASPSFLWHCYAFHCASSGWKILPRMSISLLTSGPQESTANICRCHLWERLSHTMHGCLQLSFTYKCHLLNIQGKSQKVCLLWTALVFMMGTCRDNQDGKFFTAYVP